MKVFDSLKQAHCVHGCSSNVYEFFHLLYVYAILLFHCFKFLPKLAHNPTAIVLETYTKHHLVCTIYVGLCILL